MRTLAAAVCLGLRHLRAPPLAEAPEASLRPLPRPALAPADHARCQAAANRAACPACAPDRCMAWNSSPPQLKRRRPRFRSLPRPWRRRRSRSHQPQPRLTAPTVATAAPEATVTRTALNCLRPSRHRARTAPRACPEPSATADGPRRLKPLPPSRILPRQERESIRRKGSVCGDPAIKGETLAPITSRVRGCGIEEPVRVTSVDGVQLSRPRRWIARRRGR